MLLLYQELFNCLIPCEKKAEEDLPIPSGNYNRVLLQCSLYY
jgi:hypothetical protein